MKIRGKADKAYTDYSVEPNMTYIELSPKELVEQMTQQEVIELTQCRLNKTLNDKQFPPTCTCKDFKFYSEGKTLIGEFKCTKCGRIIKSLGFNEPLPTQKIEEIDLKWLDEHPYSVHTVAMCYGKKLNEVIRAINKERR